MSATDQLLDKIHRLRNIMLAAATANGEDAQGYKSLREALMKDAAIGPLLPPAVKRHAYLGEFIESMKAELGRYSERREHIRKQFAPLIERLENASASPLDEVAAVAMNAIDSEHVRGAWEKALERRATDPEGAITAARTLLETVCKHILDEDGISYSIGAELPHLFHATLEHMDVAPSQQTEQVFKAILGNCESIVGNLASVRNRLSDAHGRGRDGASPAPYHAELAVNLAGAVATFLVAVWEEHEEP